MVRATWANDEFTDKTAAPSELRQTDFTYLKVAGWGWYYLSTVQDDFSRFVVAWKLRTTMQASDVIETLDLALAASGLDQVKVRHRPRLLSDRAIAAPPVRTRWRGAQATSPAILRSGWRTMA